MAATSAPASLETSLTRLGDDGRALLFTEARTARPPTSAHRTRTAFRSATEVRSADSADATVSFSGAQAQVPAARGLGQPCPHHAVDLIPVSLRMLTVHPLPVQPDTELVHVQGRLYPRGFRSPVLCCRAACSWPPFTKAGDDRPERARWAPGFSGHRAPYPRP
jgi:hypothetical protein